MINVEEAQKIINGQIQASPVVLRNLTEAQGLVLRENISSDRDSPPFHRVAMDGIAICLKSTKDENRTFTIEGTQRAGQSPFSLKDTNGCIEVMTGCVLPEGCDCVVRVEDLEIKEMQATIAEDVKLDSMMNIHQKASDLSKDTLILKEGCMLGPSQIAVLASVGKHKIKVSKTPSIAIISTGDEIVKIDQKPLDYQIRQTNTHAIQAGLTLRNYSNVDTFHIVDDRSLLEDELTKILEFFDIIILSGGISKGKFDFLPDVLTSLGVENQFHGVNQRPGKPFWYGTGSKGQQVFALPGNPVSAQTCFRRFVIPALDTASCMTTASTEEWVKLSEDFTFKKGLTYFLPVKLSSHPNGDLTAKPIITNGSGDFISLTQSDGFIELDATMKDFPAGHVAKLFKWN